MTSTVLFAIDFNAPTAFGIPLGVLMLVFFLMWALQQGQGNRSSTSSTPQSRKRNRRPANSCPKCGFSHKYNGRTCDHCGYGGGQEAQQTQELSSSVLSPPPISPNRQCPFCGGQLAGDFPKCQHCGSDVAWVNGIPCQPGVQDHRPIYSDEPPISSTSGNEDGPQRDAPIAKVQSEQSCRVCGQFGTVNGLCMDCRRKFNIRW